MLVGMDVGGTNLRVGVIDQLRVVHEQRYHADFSSLCGELAPLAAEQAICDRMTQVLRETIAAYPAITGIGIGFPGFIAPEGGIVCSSPNLPGLANVNITQALSASLNLPVVVENDALAAAYGEYRLASGTLPGLVYLGLGTGVGGGLIVASRPFAGEHGVAMEVGHLIVEPGGRLCGCGNHGCMEKYASATGVALSYQETTGQLLSADEIARLAGQGDSAAVAAYQRAGVALAQSLAHILKVVDVGYVVIGGGMSAAWPLMKTAFDAQLDADLIPVLRGKVQVSISRSGDQAGMIGAALLAAR